MQTIINNSAAIYMNILEEKIIRNATAHSSVFRTFVHYDFSHEFHFDFIPFSFYGISHFKNIFMYVYKIMKNLLL